MARMARRAMRKTNERERRANSTPPQSRRDDWKKWRESGKNALEVACLLHHHGRYSYACFVGQESLELYVKSFLLKYNPNTDPIKIRHDPYGYVVGKLTEYVKQVESSGQPHIDMSDAQNAMEGIHATLRSLHGGINRTLWMKHMSSPRNAGNNLLADTMVSDKIKEDKPTHDSMKKTQADHPELSFVLPTLNEPDIATSIEMSRANLKTYIISIANLGSKNPAKAFAEHKWSIMESMSFFFVVRWNATISIAQSHQQYARYPENVDDSKYTASNAAYTKEVSQDLLDRVSHTIYEIETTLDATLEPDF